MEKSLPCSGTNARGLDRSTSDVIYLVEPELSPRLVMIDRFSVTLWRATASEYGSMRCVLCRNALRLAEKDLLKRG